MDITLTPELVSSIYSNAMAYEFATAFFGVVMFFFVIAILFDFIPSMIKKIVDPKGSKEYRDLLSDMYVVGMVKKFATEDGIDLLAELKELNKISKKGKIELKTIDRVVEAELKEKIANVQEEALTKTGKKD